MRKFINEWLRDAKQSGRTRGAMKWEQLPLFAAFVMRTYA
jgi:hypothetical protein